MLSSMNLEVVSTSRIFYDGLTVIHAWWSSKDLAEPLMQELYGLPPTFTPENGTQTSTQTRSMHFYDGW